jgi:hypothetical protein
VVLGWLVVLVVVDLTAYRQCRPDDALGIAPDQPDIGKRVSGGGKVAHIIFIFVR